MSGTNANNPLFVAMASQGNVGWATETTLKKLLTALDPKTPSKEGEVARQALEENSQQLKDNSEKTRYYLQQAGQVWKSALTEGIQGGQGLFTNISQSTKLLAQDFEEQGKANKLAISGLQRFATVALLVSKSLEKLIEADKIFSDLYETGVRLQGGINGLITSSNTARLSVQEFGALATKNSTVFAQLGGRDVPKLIKTFQDTSRYGGEYLLSLQDGAEMFLQTVDIYQQAGVAGRLNNQQLVASSQGLINQFGKVSEATGLSRKALIDFVSSITKTGSSYLLLSTMSAKAGENLIAATAQLAKFGQQGGKLLADNIQKYFAGSNTFGLLDESMQHLISTVPGLGGSFANLAEASVKGGEEYEDAQKQFAKTLIAAPESLRRQLLAAMPELAGTLGDLIKNAKNVEQAEKDKLEQMEAEAKRRGMTLNELKAERAKEAEEDKKRKEVLNKLTEAFNKLNNEIFRSFASAANYLITPLGYLADGITWLSEKFNDIDKAITSAVGLGGQGGILGSVIAFGAAIGASVLAVKGFRSIVSMFGGPKGAPGIGASGIGPGIPGSTPQNPIYTREVSAGGLGGGGLGGGAPGRPGQAGGGRFGRLGSMLGRGSIGGLVAGAALGGLGTAATGAGYGKTGAGLDILGQAAGLAGTGAMLGAFLGPGGALVGGALGGLAGAGMGLYQHSGTLFGGGGADAQRSPEQAAGQMSLLEQIDKMLEDRQGLNLQYSETGQALKDFSAGYREVISAISLTPGAGGFDNLSRVLGAVSGRAETPASAPEYQGMNTDWQADTLNIWKNIRELNENMKDLLSSMNTNLATLVTDRPVQGAGLSAS
jgi:hypothetical protein